MTSLDGYLSSTGELYFETIEFGPDGVCVLKSEMSSLILFPLFYRLNRRVPRGLNPMFFTLCENSEDSPHENAVLGHLRENST